MRVCRAACLVALGAMTSLHAQDRGFWAFLEPGRVIPRCLESSPAHQQAATSLAHLNDLIERLKSTDPKARAEQALRALLRSECFLPAAETARVPTPDSSESLQQWWLNGGRHWLASYLELPRLGLISDLIPHIVVPPDARRTLSLEGQTDHPLQSLLCARTDVSCGAATRGWQLRADAHFESHRALRQKTGPDDRPTAGVDLTSRECAEKASSSSEGPRYMTWRACIEARRPRRVAMPLGLFQAPAAGWIVISGRRGHYDFCDTTRAYDLATGAAYVSDSCSGLALKSDGGVDSGGTDKARVERISAGTVPVQNLREAVWMLLFGGEVEEVQLQAEYYPLPPGLVPVVRPDRQREGSDSSMWAHTGQTTLTWRWVPPTGSAFLGELTWPNSYDAAQDHAASLLKIAEEGMAGKCAEQPVPTPNAIGSRRARQLNDVSAESIQELAQDFAKAFHKWKALPPCRPGAR